MKHDAITDEKAKRDMLPRPRWLYSRWFAVAIGLLFFAGSVFSILTLFHIGSTRITITLSTLMQGVFWLPVTSLYIRLFEHPLGSINNGWGYVYPAPGLDFYVSIVVVLILVTSTVQHKYTNGLIFQRSSRIRPFERSG